MDHYHKRASFSPETPKGRHTIQRTKGKDETSGNKGTLLIYMNIYDDAVSTVEMDRCIHLFEARWNILLGSICDSLLLYSVLGIVFDSPKLF